jgi:hypothetical protein
MAVDALLGLLIPLAQQHRAMSSTATGNVGSTEQVDR